MSKRPAQDTSGGATLGEKRPKLNDSMDGEGGDPDLLKLLGEEPLGLEPEYGPDVDDELAQEWSNLLTIGNLKEHKEQAERKYHIPKNIPAMRPPSLNPELEMFVYAPQKREDKYMTSIQENIGIGLAALASAVDRMMKNKRLPKEIKEEILPSVRDAGNIICGAFRMLSTSRKFNLQSKFNKNLKNIVKDCKADEKYLYGQDLNEKLNIGKKDDENVKEEATVDTSVADESQEIKVEVEEGGEASETVETAETIADDVDPAVIELLRDEKEKVPMGPEVHSAIATRWCKFLQLGVDKKEILQFGEKYLIPKNIPYLQAPRINPEINKMKELDRVGDRYIAQMQRSMGIGLSAMAEIIDKLLRNEVNQGDIKTTVLPPIADAAKIMCGVVNALSVNRKHYIEIRIPRPYRQLVRDSIPDEFLCGKDCGDKMKQIQEALPQILRNQHGNASTNQKTGQNTNSSQDQSGGAKKKKKFFHKGRGFWRRQGNRGGRGGGQNK